MITTAILEYLSEHGHMDQLYESLQHDDYSEVVLAALDVLTKTGQMPKFHKVTKCEIKSTMHRKYGNEKYLQHKYHEVLLFYNNAILFAPENSTASILSYGNRSALLYKIKAYKACLNDIETCFNIGCTDQSLAAKLAQRRRECERYIKADRRVIMERGTFGATFFDFNVKRNPQIPCASLDVGVVKETDTLKVVAVRNIEVGTVVALETAYACELKLDHQYLACYYCHKFELNLIPCDKCCEVMFCSETCKVRCNNEFHDIECQIMNCIMALTHIVHYKLSIKTAIKIRRSCSSWEEFTNVCKNIGVERMKGSSVNEIYDVKNKFSILCFDKDLHFQYGQLFNGSLLTAIVIYYLKEVPSFFPEKQEERDEAIQAFARVLVNLGLFYTNVEIQNFTMDNTIIRQITQNYGWFSFTGKLKHDCDANLLVLGLNNKVALIAIKPIKKDNELTISYNGHYFENLYVDRHQVLFKRNQISCNCRVCTERWSIFQHRNQKLNKKLQRLIMSCFANENALQIDRLRNAEMFKKVCNALTALQEAPATKEHAQLFMEFRRFTCLWQVVYTDNVLPSND